MENPIRLSALQEQLHTVRERFLTHGAAQFNDAVDHAALRVVVAPWLEELRRVAVYNQRTGHIGERDIVVGGRHRRVDVGHPSVTEEQTCRMDALLTRSGLTALGQRMATIIGPIVESVVGATLAYQRIQILIYGPDDYLGPHTDEQSGNRYNIQTALISGCVSGLRLFGGEHPTVLSDWSGSLRILGPNVWHEVLPLLPLQPDQSGERIVFSMRFECPDEE